MEDISTDNIYIDGTKIEAYANRYSFVWKKSVKNYWNKLNDKIQALVLDFNQEFNSNLSSFFEIYHYLKNLNINFVHGRGKRKSKEQKYFELCAEYLERYEKYSKHFQNLKERNSYSKTDIDATFMRMKDDYMRNG